MARSRANSFQESFIDIAEKVNLTLSRLQTFEPEEGYYLAFSGGKDSVTIYRLAEMAGVQFDAHYNATTVDPPELVRFIKREYPRVEFHVPEVNMWRLMIQNQWPPLREQRYCCRELKESGGHGRIVLTGIRWAESMRRSNRQMVERCFSDGTKSFVNPIIDWSDLEVWQFIRQNHVPYCSLYDEGFKRLGCILCPMVYNTRQQIRRWPQVAAKYIETFGRLLEVRADAGKETTFKTGREWFDWWVDRKQTTRKGKESSEAQMVIFE